jgi:hypothetical protein
MAILGPLVYCSRFGMFGPRKIWQPCKRKSEITVGESGLVCLRKGTMFKECSSLWNWKVGLDNSSWKCAFVNCDASFIEHKMAHAVIN